ncbi:MAG: hypothetical protein WDA29_10300 [Flavobacteriaceae bacterium]
MTKKNLFMVLFALATAMFYSCESDDSSNNGNTDNTPGETSAMIGTWKALMLYYTEGGNEYPLYLPGSWYRICGVPDYLTISAPAVAKLTETLDDDESSFECIEIVKTGSWTETTITIPGESVPRKIIQQSETTFTLEYPDNSYHNLGVIKVQYSKE